jgi:hypothetical protein
MSEPIIAVLSRIGTPEQADKPPQVQIVTWAVTDRAEAVDIPAA